MKRIAIILFLLIPVVLSAQRRGKLRYNNELSFGIGTTNVFGDIGGTSAEENFFGLRDLDITSTRYSFSFGYRYYFTERISAKGFLMYGNLYGTDKGSKNPNRIDHYKTNMFEGSLQAEFYILPYQLKPPPGYDIMQLRSGYKKSLLRFIPRPYIFVGIGASCYMPKEIVSVSGEVYDNMSTDNGVAIVVPIGIGSKLEFNAITLGAELGGRITTTDFLDAYSNPEFSDSKDIYYSFIVSFAYTLDYSKVFKKWRF